MPARRGGAGGARPQGISVSVSVSFAVTRGPPNAYPLALSSSAARPEVCASRTASRHASRNEVRGVSRGGSPPVSLLFPGVHRLCTLRSSTAREGGAAQSCARSPTSHVSGTPSSRHGSPPRRVRSASTSSAETPVASNASPTSSTSWSAVRPGSPQGCTHTARRRGGCFPASPLDARVSSPVTSTTCAAVRSARVGPTCDTSSDASAVKSFTFDAGTSAVSGRCAAMSRPSPVEYTSTPQHACSRSRTASIRP
mmetsp:Transcript_3985/g.15872  ORF Transcript_3985/g.15872 Transcript_3985/m.15872 type:complete len:254 (-) Transcript_3985:82-843(-)